MQIASKFIRIALESVTENEFYDPKKWSLKNTWKEFLTIAQLHFWFHMMPALFCLPTILFSYENVCGFEWKNEKREFRKSLLCCAAIAFNGDKICATNWSSGKYFLARARTRGLCNVSLVEEVAGILEFECHIWGCANRLKCNKNAINCKWTFWKLQREQRWTRWIRHKNLKTIKFKQ